MTKFSAVKLISSHLTSVDKAARKAGVDRMFELLLSSFPDSVSSIDLSAYLVEREWVKLNNRNTIFPDSVAFLEHLGRAKFELGKGAIIHPPFQTFAISFPKEYLIEGVCPAACFVQIATPNERTNDIQEYLKSIGLDHDVNFKTTMELDEPVLYMYFVSPWGDSSIHGLVTPFSSLPSVLGADGVNEFSDRIGTMEDFNKTAMSVSELENSFNQKLLKIITSMLVFNSATNGSNLVKGLPKNAPILAMKKQGVIMNGVKLGGSYRHAISPHARRMHFRNLQHDRFYQGEHEKLPTGSRWVLVQPSAVALKASTLKP
jgi:hypothetical protein